MALPASRFSDAQIDARLEAASLKLAPQDAPAVRALARSFLVKAELIRVPLSAEQEPAHVFSATVAVRR